MMHREEGCMTIEVLSDLYQDPSLSKKLNQRARSMLRDDGLAEDAVQITFVKLLGHLKARQAGSMSRQELIGCLFKALKHCAIDILRSRQTHAAVSMDATGQDRLLIDRQLIDEDMVSVKVRSAW